MPKAIRIYRLDNITWSNRHPLNETLNVSNRKLTALLAMCIKVDFETGRKITFAGAGAQIVESETGG